MLSNLEHASSLTPRLPHRPPQVYLPANTGPLNVSYARQDYTPSSVNLPVILYIPQP